MIVHIQPTNITGRIVAPASKSSMQRACAAALLCKGVSTIKNPGVSNDDLAAIDVIQKLGASVATIEDGSLSISSTGVAPADVQINCGESGLGIRMFTPIAALSSEQLTINGTGSLLTRPMHFFDEILPQLGISVQSNSGKLPISIKGPLKPSDISIDGSLSSQFLTGLLMAYGASVSAPVTISVSDLKSKPYIDLTLKVMNDFGCQVENIDYKQFKFNGLSTSYVPREYTVEGDWSGAAFLLVAGAIAGELVITGLDTHSPQADRAVLEALRLCGSAMQIDEQQITIAHASLQAFTFDATDCPDLFPPLVALAAVCQGTTQIHGVSRLAHKESDRGLTLQQEFAKLGVEILLDGDVMSITGVKQLKSAKVHSRHDHRIAMACAVAALRAEGEVIIEEAEAINKSYPDFFDDLKELGSHVNVRK